MTKAKEQGIKRDVAAWMRDSYGALTPEVAARRLAVYIEIRRELESDLAIAEANPDVFEPQLLALMRDHYAGLSRLIERCTV